MLLPEVAVTFFAFWISLDPNQGLLIKYVEKENDYFRFKTPVPIDALPQVKKALGDSLVFGDKYVKVEQSLFEKGLSFEVSSQKQRSAIVAEFEDHDLVICKQKEEDKMFKLSQDEKYTVSNAPKIVESYWIATEALENKHMINEFDINLSNPEEWIKSVETAMSTFRADPNKYGQQVLAFLLNKQGFRWLKEQIAQEPSIEWTPLSKSFVEFVKKWQSEETEISSLPNKSNDPLEEQIENKIKFIKQNLVTISTPHLRKLVYKQFEKNSMEDFIPQYETCSENQFKRALRLKHEQQSVQNPINVAAGLKLLFNLKKQHVEITPFDELSDNPIIWTQNVENEFNNINANLNAHGIPALAYLLDGPALEWYLEYVNNSTAPDWYNMVDAFTHHFKKYQTEQKDSLMDVYKRGDNVEQFVANKLRLWKSVSASVPQKELQTTIGKYFEEPQSSLIPKIAFFNEKAFLTGCQMLFD